MRQPIGLLLFPAPFALAAGPTGCGSRPDRTNLADGARDPGFTLQSDLSPGIATAAGLLQRRRTMFDTIKKTLLAGLGAAVLTKEKVDDVLEDFVKQGRISATDARKLADRLARQGRREFVNAATETGGRIKQVISRADRETQARIDRLVARVQRLEKRKSSGKAKPRRRRSARR